MEAVFEDVAEGHRGVGEAVHEDGFNFALEEVEQHHVEGQSLGWSGLDKAEAIDKWMDEEGTEVLDHVDGPPGYLWAYKELRSARLSRACAYGEGPGFVKRGA